MTILMTHNITMYYTKNFNFFKKLRWIYEFLDTPPPFIDIDEFKNRPLPPWMNFIQIKKKFFP